ncbi:6-phosphogluconolactonase [Pseudomonas sp. LRF_L74]|uniref:6-phosphogluconolactonase n=1 Tax=Pseudomonas sp. LRF_L74 TaxID=3369422 RepID=UPI003F6063CB
MNSYRAISELAFPDGVRGLQFDDDMQLASELAATVAEALRRAIAKRDTACLVVSGGRSPVAFFQRLAQQRLDWARVTVSLADERWLPVSHGDSNEGLVHRHLLQGQAAAARFIGLYRPAATLEEAAQAADHALAELPPIDVLVLGMGEDGHTASLFPASPNLSQALDPVQPVRCFAMQAPSVPHQRLTLSVSLLAKARRTLLAVQGQGKLRTLRRAMGGVGDEAMPIRSFLRRPLEIHWCP